MQVNASTPAKTTNPLEGLIAEKSQAQTAEEAFAAVLAQAGLNLQGSLSASFQAPQALKQAIDKPERVAAKEIERPQSREPQGRAVARGREEDKTTGQERAAEVRSDSKPERQAERAEAPSSSESSSGDDETVQVSAPANQTSASQSEKTVVTGEGANAATQVAATDAAAATVTKIEENVSAAMAAFAVQTGLVDDAADTADANTLVAAGMDVDTENTGPKQDGGPVVVAGAETKAVHVEAQGLHVENLDVASQEVEDAVAVLTQVAAKTVKSGEGQANEADASHVGADSLRDEQAAMLSRIVGNDGAVKVEATAKSSQTVSQSHASLVPGLVLAETETAQAVTAASGDFSEGMDDLGNMMQGNRGASANAGAAAGASTNGAQAAAAGLVAAQAQATSFSDAMIQAQGKAGTEGVKEIQGVQGTQASSSAQSSQAQAGLGQNQVHDVKTANAVQHVEKPHEAKLPVPPKEILDQVNVQISKAAKEGLDKITVQMRPEALGRVEVQLKLGQDGQMSAHIIADRPETLDALKRDVRSLEQSLADAGFKTDSNSLQFSLRGEQQSQQQKEANGQPRFGFDRGQALDEAPAGEAVAQTRQRAGARSGVDISV